MADNIRKLRSDGTLRLPAHTNLIEAGDLVYYASGSAAPLSTYTDAGEEEGNQAGVAPLFLGVSLERSAAGTTDDILIDCDLNGVFEFAVPSATYNVGDLLGASEDSGGTFLEDQVLESVGSEDLALFVVVKDEASAVTAVQCRMYRSFATGVGRARSRADVNIETLAAGKTMTNDDAEFQVLDPGGAVRTVTLPPEEESAGKKFYFKNAGSATEVITIQDDASGTKATIDGGAGAAGETALLFCDGVTWHAIVDQTAHTT